MLNADLGVGCNGNSEDCSGGANCPGRPDLCIKRNDTRPAFKMSVSDCDGAIDLTDENLLLEASMWFDSKLKSNIDNLTMNIQFADNIGFERILVGDLIVVNHPRSPEKMAVVSIDEAGKSVEVARAQEGTIAQSWEKGTSLKVFRFVDEQAQIESLFEEVTDLDGSVSEQLTDTFFVFNWTPSQTSMPGCYWIEFKLTKVTPGPGGETVDWTKRFPTSAGWLVNVID